MYYIKTHSLCPSRPFRAATAGIHHAQTVLERVHVSVQHPEIVAVDLVPEDGELPAPADQRVLHADARQRRFQIGNQLPDAPLGYAHIGFFFPQRRRDFLRRADGAVAADQESEKLPGLLPPEHQRLSLPENVELAEAPDGQLFRVPFHIRRDVFQLFRDPAFLDWLEHVAADPLPDRLDRVFRIGRDKHDLAGGRRLLELHGQRQPVQLRHLDIGKDGVRAEPLRRDCPERLRAQRKIHDFRSRGRFGKDPVQPAQRFRLVVNSKYQHEPASCRFGKIMVATVPRPGAD